MSDKSRIAEFLSLDHPRGVKPMNHSWLLDRVAGRGHRICKWCGLTQRPEEVIEHEAMKAYEIWIQMIDDRPKPWNTLSHKEQEIWRQNQPAWPPA